MDDTAQKNAAQEVPKVLPDSQTSQSAKKLNWKGFFIGIIIVVIIEIFAVNTLKNENKQNTITPQTIKPTVSQPTDPTANWKTYTLSLWSSNLKIKYPPTFILDENLGGFTLASSKSAFDDYLQSADTYNNSNEIIIFGTVSDLGYDTLNASQKHPLWEFIQKDMNMEFSKGGLVDGNTQVPWQNANGGTSSGQKYYYDNVPYEHIKIQGRDAARIKWNNEYIYYIPSSSGKSYADFRVQPTNSSLMKIFNTILSTYTVTENKPPYDKK